MRTKYDGIALQDAIAEGRECAREVDEFLMGSSKLEARDVSQLALTA